MTVHPFNGKPSCRRCIDRLCARLRRRTGSRGGRQSDKPGAARMAMPGAAAGAISAGMRAEKVGKLTALCDGRRLPAGYATMIAAAADLLTRYRAGDCAGARRDACRRPGSAEAEAVADELMIRDARNVEMLVGRLDRAGWRWAYPESRRSPVSQEDKEAVTALECAAGPLPLACAPCCSMAAKSGSAERTRCGRPRLTRWRTCRAARSWPTRWCCPRRHGCSGS